jgi:hypothetical protein
MGVWAWLRPGDRIWKVVSDHEKGTIQVFNEKGELILEKTNLTREAIAMVEKNFLDLAATNVDKKEADSDKEVEKDSSSGEADPMFA